MTPPLDLLEAKGVGGETLFVIQMLKSKLEAFARNPVHRHYYTDQDISDPDPESDSEPKGDCLLDQQEQDPRHRLSTPSAPARRTTESAMTTDSTTTTSFAWMDTLDPGLKASIQDTLLKALGRLRSRQRKRKDKKKDTVGAATAEVLLSERKRETTTTVMTSPPKVFLRQAHSYPLPLRRTPTMFLDISQAHGRANRGHRGQLQPVGLEEELRQEEEVIKVLHETVKTGERVERGQCEF